MSAYVIRLGTAATALHSFLREHDDGDTSWTSSADAATAFLTADAAKRYAGRRLGGSWHVATVDRSRHRRLVLDEEFDTVPETDAGVEAALARLVPAAEILTREHGAMVTASLNGVSARATRRAEMQAFRL